ncbi:MAG: hypothetical protein QF685_07265 [Verrucomicrobiota bacterium]|jgi:hypothetical protein|nr:hypothetical protein [Verrucomicrobiota bacterium]
MRTLIVLIIGLLAVGCGKTEIEKFGEETNFTKLPVVGSYYATGSDEEGKAVSTKIVFHENGNVEWFQSDKSPQPERKWMIVRKEIHMVAPSGTISVWGIETNGDLTCIARINDGKREEAPKEIQIPWKKLNSSLPSKMD